MYPFHMPGHKRRGDEIHQIDITEIDGFDNLHDPESLILEEMKRAADFYGTQDTFFSVNGSTCALLTAISAAVPFGGTLLTERGCHISVYHAAYLRHLHLLYTEDFFPDCGHGQETVPDAVVITSPSYEGCVKDLSSWVSYVRKKNIPLIVDEAHGAHFSMHPYFPESAIQSGADLVIQSVHKTLPAMTQTALLHNVTGRVSSLKLEEFLDIYETSSPSYVLMASITSCLHQVMDPNQDLFERYAVRLKKLRKELSQLTHLELAGGEDCILKKGEFLPYPEGTRTDPGKLYIQIKDSALSGPELYDLLRTQYYLQPEMKTPDAVLLMTSVYDTEDGFRRLTDALSRIDSELTVSKKKEGKPVLSQKSGIPDCCCTIDKAVDSPEKEDIFIEEAEGRVSASYIIVYPPDSPLILPGEVFSRDVILSIKKAKDAGLILTGLKDNRVCVLSEV